MPSPHHSILYRLEALPDTQPTASKHWRHPYCKKPMLYIPKGTHPQQVEVDLGANAKAVKAELKNIQAEASWISVEPKLQNVSASQSKRQKFAAHFFPRFNTKMGWVVIYTIVNFEFSTKGTSSTTKLIRLWCGRLIFNPNFVYMLNLTNFSGSVGKHFKLTTEWLAVGVFVTP